MKGIAIAHAYRPTAQKIFNWYPFSSSPPSTFVENGWNFRGKTTHLEILPTCCGKNASERLSTVYWVLNQFEGNNRSRRIDEYPFSSIHHKTIIRICHFVSHQLGIPINPVQFWCYETWPLKIWKNSGANIMVIKNIKTGLIKGMPSDKKDAYACRSTVGNNPITLSIIIRWKLQASRAAERGVLARRPTAFVLYLHASCAPGTFVENG